jgi:MYXO-CTERM domain-containing protein
LTTNVPEAGTGYDVLAVGGDVTIAGSMSVSRIGGYVPSVGASYTVLTSGGADPDTGMFATVTDPNGVTLTTTYNPNNVVLGVTAVTIVPTDAGMEGGVEAGADAGRDGSTSTDAGKTHNDAGKNPRQEAGAGGADGGGDGGSGESGSSGGCGCVAAGKPATENIWLLPLVVMIAFGLRRSRARSR